jgi:acetolactate synthase-1/2/3 large subunit
MRNVCDGGEAILEALRRLGVDYIISSPGSEWAPVWEALVRQKVSGAKGPRYIDCWHETLAVDMALGYTMVTGRPQAVLLHAGPGLLQGAAAIQAAHSEEIPLLVMSGEALSYGEDPRRDPGAQWYRALNLTGGPDRLVEPIVKWSNKVTSAATLHESVVRGGEMAERSPRGAVYLNVPVETMLEDWTPPAAPRRVPRPPKVQPHPDEIEQAARRLIASRNPMVVTDRGGRDPAAFAALVDLAELLGMPVAEGPSCTYANFPKDHPLHAGFDLAPLLAGTDLALVIDSSAPWYPPSNRPKHASVIAISDNPLKTQMVFQALEAELYLEGDVASSLRMLIDRVGAVGIEPQRVAERQQRWAIHHRQLEEKLRAAEAKAMEAQGIEVAALCAALRRAMPADAVYIDETTTHRPGLQRHLPCHAPQSYFHLHAGLGQGLGYGLGVKLAARKRMVVILIGDGAFLYNPVIQSLAAANENDLPVLIVVLNNGKYQAMKNSHLQFYADGAAVAEDLFHGVPIKGPAYELLGAPFSCAGFKAERPGEVEQALRAARAAVESGQTAIVNLVMAR